MATRLERVILYLDIFTLHNCTIGQLHIEEMFVLIIFGNQDTDVKAYTYCGLPMER